MKENIFRLSEELLERKDSARSSSFWQASHRTRLHG